MKISFFTQTTIIWDAHTGEAKQQFPFHSGEWQESAASLHVTFHTRVRLFLDRCYLLLNRSETTAMINADLQLHTLWLLYEARLIFTHFAQQLGIVTTICT